jgi:prophage regulatory protein
MKEGELAELGVLRLPQVMSLVGLSRSSIYLAVSRGEFPRQIQLGARAVGWRRSDVEVWIANRKETPCSI